MNGLDTSRTSNSSRMKVQMNWGSEVTRGAAAAWFWRRRCAGETRSRCRRSRSSAPDRRGTESDGQTQELAVSRRDEGRQARLRSPDLTREIHSTRYSSMKLLKYWSRNSRPGPRNATSWRCISLLVMWATCKSQGESQRKLTEQFNLTEIKYTEKHLNLF